MKLPTCTSIIVSFLFIIFVSFYASSAGWANSPLEDSSDAKVLIDEIRQLRTDLQRYSLVNYKVQAHLGRLQVQMVKLNAVRDNLTAIGVELENLNSQNATEKEVLDKLNEQASQELINKTELNMQINGIKKSISDRDKLMGEIKSKEVLKEAEVKEEQRKLEAILYDINMLEAELRSK